MGNSGSTGKRSTCKKGGRRGIKRRYRGGRTKRMRKKRGGGCGCNGTNASSTNMYGGWQYSRKASLDAERRLSKRLSHQTHKKRKKDRKNI